MKLFISIAVLFCVTTVTAQTNDVTSTDVLESYKKAVSAPPDVEYFIAGLKPLGEPEIQGRKVATTFHFFAGARAQTNYYIYSIAASNSPVMKIGVLQGKSGDANYQFSENAVTYSVGTNEAQQVNGVYFKLASQFLNMGLGDIVPHTVVWEERLNFQAQDVRGKPRYGALILSNELPHRLTISEKPGSTAIKSIQYVYPDPPAALNGFPARMIVSSAGPSGLVPDAEMALMEVRLAKESLPNTQFSENQFKRTNIIHTNIYSNDVMFVTDKKGKIIKAPPAQF